MKKWIVKAIVQKIISYLPFSDSINFLFQKYITKGVQLSDEYFFDRLEHAKTHISNFYRKNNAHPINTLEIGTGWYPIVPISMFLVGVDSVNSFDISPLLNKNRLLTTIRRFVELYDKGELKNWIDFDKIRIEKLLELNNEQLTFEELLTGLRLQYSIKDARKTDILADSIDFIHSNNTFEHIYPYVLEEILSEFQRILKKEGLMSHFIDMSDHFAHFDKSINIYHFLRFSEYEWKLIDNSVQPQNRFRLKDYEVIYSNLNIPIVETSNRAGRIEELKTILLDKKYKTYTLEELAISHSYVFSTKK